MMMHILMHKQCDNAVTLMTPDPSYIDTWKEGIMYEVVPGKLYFSAQRDDNQTTREISGRPDYFFFSGNFQEQYLALGADFGPVNLALVHRFRE